MNSSPSTSKRKNEDRILRRPKYFLERFVGTDSERHISNKKVKINLSKSQIFIFSVFENKVWICFVAGTPPPSPRPPYVIVC